MPFYLMRVSYTGTAAAHLVQHPQHRENAVRTTCEALGGKMHHFFYSFGDYDAMAIAELPNNKAAAAAALSVEASGAVRQMQTTVLHRGRGDGSDENRTIRQIQAACLSGFCTSDLHLRRRARKENGGTMAAVFVLDGNSRR